MKKIAAIILSVIMLIVAVAAIVWHKEISTIRSVSRVDGNEYLYTMEYKAGYDLDEVIESDIDENAELLQYVVSRAAKGLPVKISGSKVEEAGKATGGFSCTSFQAGKAGSTGFLYGRNYDFFKNPTMVTFSHPSEGYASVAVSDMSHFGYGLDRIPGSAASKALCLASIYAPVDGMNEKGLCTSIMALPAQASQQETERHDVGTTIIMRLWLDRCASVDEALDLLRTVDVRHDAAVGSGYHYMVADASGDCAVVEFDKEDGWKTMVVRKEEGRSSMVVTNHLLSPRYYTTIPDQSVGNTHSRSWWRYETASAYLDARNGTVSVEEAQECLSEVHWKDLQWENGVVEDTQYSNVYDQSTLTLYLRNWNSYDKTNIFTLTK